LLVAVPCFVGDLEGVLMPLLDTASQWCILAPDVAEALGLGPPDEDVVHLHTRFGLLTGSLERLPVRFRPDDGETVTIQAT